MSSSVERSRCDGLSMMFSDLLSLTDPNASRYTDDPNVIAGLDAGTDWQKFFNILLNTLKDLDLRK